MEEGESKHRLRVKRSPTLHHQTSHGEALTPAAGVTVKHETEEKTHGSQPHGEKEKPRSALLLWILENVVILWILVRRQWYVFEELKK